jgi:hypothetical protein
MGRWSRRQLPVQPTIVSTRPVIYWQLVWFALLAIMYGSGYIFAIVQPGRRLPAGLDDLPSAFLFALAAGWLLAGFFALTSAAVIRRRHWQARVGLGVMLGFWFGAYMYGWLSGGNPTGWIGAGLHLFIGLAVVTPPVWTVTINAKQGP